MRTKWRVTLFSLVGVGAAAALLSQTLPLLASDQVTSNFSPNADTTVTQVSQDGDTSAKSTLATCPQLCDNNPSAERDAVLEFKVSGLPANVSKVKATLKIYSWTAYNAAVAAYPASGGAHGTGTWADRPTLGSSFGTHSSVTKGYNTWNVSTKVTGNGTYSFAVLQSSYASRIYWASLENTTTSTRPVLSVSYQTSGATSSPSATTSATTKPSATSGATASATPTSTGSSQSSASASRSATASPTATVPGWTLAWADEFNGTALDTTKWNARNNSWLDYDSACITSRQENVFESNGILTLRATKENYTCGSKTRAYTDAYLDTIGKASFTYGRFEVRAKSPNGASDSTGLWPAFWLRPDDGGNGEIDVTELPGGSSWYNKSTQAIIHDYLGQSDSKQDHRTWPATVGGYPGDGFHTYATEWESGVVRWYIDGVLVWTRDTTTTTWMNSTFSRPYHLRLNFQVGGWLGEPTSATAFPADFQVDYVRVWKR